MVKRLRIIYQVLSERGFINISVGDEHDILDKEVEKRALENDKFGFIPYDSD